MNTRPVAAAFFVVFCLLLCGLILRRQIAAHPLPPDTRPQYGQSQQGFDFQNWPLAPASTAKQVQSVVQGELDALRGGEAARALAYRSRSRRQQFSDPNQFLQLVRERHPELLRDHAVRFGPVRTDPMGENAWTVVFMEGPGGERTQSGFLLAREDGEFKISRIRSQALPN